MKFLFMFADAGMCDNIYRGAYSFPGTGYFVHDCECGRKVFTAVRTFMAWEIF